MSRLPGYGAATRAAASFLFKTPGETAMPGCNDTRATHCAARNDGGAITGRGSRFCACLQTISTWRDWTRRQIYLGGVLERCGARIRNRQLSLAFNGWAARWEESAEQQMRAEDMRTKVVSPRHFAMRGTIEAGSCQSVPVLPRGM